MWRKHRLSVCSTEIEKELKKKYYISPSCMMESSLLEMLGGHTASNEYVGDARAQRMTSEMNCPW